VILHGPVGVGKTMIAQAFGHQACRRGHTATFTKTSRLRRWARPHLLILDDFAIREFTPTQADDLYELWGSPDFSEGRLSGSGR
jgi:DNA replication protein DnaC